MYFKAFVVGKVGTLYYPADQPTTNYLESSGTWLVEISSLLPADGDMFVVMFANSCSSYAGADTGTVDLSGPSQDIGTTYLAYEAGIDEIGSGMRFSVRVSPSPFNRGCAIEVTGAGNVKAEVFNILGQSVRTLFKGRSSGKVVLRWEPDDDKPSGVYFIKVSLDSASVVKRVFFMK